MIGRVVSTKSKNTATVLVERVAKDPLYKKTYMQSKKYLVNDLISVKIGDVVSFINCKPVSKNKHWQITKVMGKNFAEIAKEQLKKEAEQVIAQVMPETSESVDQSVSGSEEKQTDTQKHRPTETPKKKASRKKETK